MGANAGDPDPELSLTVAYGRPADEIQGSGASRVAGQEVATSQGLPSRYRIIRSHARGGLGEVFVAVDAELNRQVALKELLSYHAHDPDSQSRFVLEAELTGRLEHPGIVPVYGLGRHPDGRPYYAMRFIEGETLKAAIERFHGREQDRHEPRERQMAFRRLLGSLIDACNAVAYAHSRGVVHRDLKPENIMLGRFGETLVVDWGVAKAASDSRRTRAAEPGRQPAASEDSSLTRPGAAVGTPRYMSPEQALGELERVGPASDVYGLGATLYCLLVGHSPFPDGDVSEVLDRVQRGIFPAPRRLQRSVDPVLEAICLKAMAPKPEDRHASPLDLAEEIEAWLADVRYRGEQVEAANQVKGSLARLCIERAHNLLDRGKHAEGMLWLARALENVPADSPGFERVVRASLGSWHARASLMERTLPHKGEVRVAGVQPRRASARHGLRRRHGAALGRGLGHEAGLADASRRPRHGGRVQPRRQAARHDGQRRHAQDLECPDGQADRQADGSRWPGHGGPLQPRRLLDRDREPGGVAVPLVGRAVRADPPAGPPASGGRRHRLSPRRPRPRHRVRRRPRVLW